MQRPLKAIQVAEVYKTLEDAQAGLEFQSIQEGYLGGRIKPPSVTKKNWHIQAFHTAEGISEGASLPDGMRLVIIPNSLRRVLLGEERND